MARDMGSFTVLNPVGDDNDARLFAAAELERLARELDQPAPPVTPQSKAYTAYVFPSGAPGYAAGSENDPVRIQFPYADRDLLAATMRRELEHLYGTGGTDRIRHLEHGIFLPWRLRQLRGDGPPALRSYPNIVPFASPEEDRQAYEAVLAAFRTVSRQLTDAAQVEVSKVQREAQKLALRQLSTARTQIRAEAAGYLDLGTGGTSPERLLGSRVPPSQVVLRGPRLAGLIGALRDVHAARDAVERAGRERARTGNPAVVEAAAYLALVLSVRAIDFPVLHRIWNVPALPGSVHFGARPDGRPALVADDRAGAAAIAALRLALVTSLRTAWEANASFAGSVGADADLVWRYAPLINRTLAAMQITDPSVGHRAAQERLTDEEGLSLLGYLGLGSAALSIGATAAAAAPPVLLALAIIGAVIGLADVSLDYLKRRQQNQAYYAVLDPSLAVAAETGFLGVLVGVALSLLDLKGVRDAVVAARAAGAARRAATLVDLVTP